MAAAVAAEPGAAVSEEPSWFSGIVQLTNRMLGNQPIIGNHSMAADSPAAAPAFASEPDPIAADAPVPEQPGSATYSATDDPATSRDAAPPPATADAPPPPTFTEDTCPVCMEDLTEAKAWPANCGHSYCARCTEACLRRSLNCPICRATAPEDARPGPSREAVLLTAVMMIRLRELDRLRQQESQSQSSSNRNTRSRGTSSLGRWVHRRYVAANNYVDSLLD